jgi:hypothetical protein
MNISKGVAITVDPQSVATELTIAAYLEVILLLDTKGGHMLVSLYEEGREKEDDS